MAGKYRSVLKENKIIKILLDDSWFTSTDEKNQNKRQILILRTFTRSSWIFLHVILKMQFGRAVSYSSCFSKKKIRPLR